MPLLWNTGQLDICSPPALQSAHRSAPRKSTASACAAALLEVRKPPYVAARIRCSLKQYPQSVLPYKKLSHSAFLRSVRSVQCACSPCSDGICPQAQICQMSGTAFRQSQYSAAFHARPEYSRKLLNKGLKSMQKRISGCICMGYVQDLI